MPTNVSPEFDRQRQIYEDTDDLEQRIIELQKLLSLAPRHKGGERMVMDYRKKMAQMKALVEKRKEQGCADDHVAGESQRDVASLAERPGSVSQWFLNPVKRKHCSNSHYDDVQGRGLPVPGQHDRAESNDRPVPEIQ